MNLGNAGIRTGALVFLCAVLGYAHSGFYVSSAQGAFKAGHYEQALVLYQKADSIFSHKSTVNEGLAVSFRKLAAKNPALLPQLSSSLERWAQSSPFSGKAVVYLAEFKIKSLEAAKKPFTEGEWRTLKPLLEKAVRLEPGNAWAAYKSSELAVRFRKLWNREDRNTVLDWLIKAARVRYRNKEWKFIENASPYLDSVLRLLRQEGFSYETMLAAVPEDYLSQRVWMEFLTKNNLWEYRQRAYPLYQKTAEIYYDQQCRRGEEFLRHGSELRAYYAFRKAFWSRDWGHIRAKAGILAAEVRLGKNLQGVHELMREDILTLLKQILEEEDYPVSRELLKPLGNIQALQDNPDLKILWASRMAGLKSWKIPEISGGIYDPSLWWGDGAEAPLKAGAKMNYPLFTLKGLNKGSVQLKLVSADPKAYAVVVARVNQREVGEFLADNKEAEKSFFFDYTSAGGKRWLQLEVTHFEPGDVRLIYGKTEAKLEERTA